jgi:hypothetical protein
MVGVEGWDGVEIGRNGMLVLEGGLADIERRVEYMIRWQKWGGLS